MNILMLVWPPIEFLNHNKTCIHLALDKIVQLLIGSGHKVQYLCLYNHPDQHVRYCVSGLFNSSLNNIVQPDIIWHAVPDPAPIEAIKAIHDLPIDANYIINNVASIIDHTKHKYLPLLADAGVGAAILSNYVWAGAVPGGHGTRVSLDKKAVLCYSQNNWRNLERHNITLSYRDNSSNGLRSFFRVPYAFGKCLTGFKYYCDASILYPKSGNAKNVQQYDIPEPYSTTIATVMGKLGVDIAHLEGLHPTPESIEIFDVNTFPSSEGSTLTPMSKEIVKRLVEVFK